MKLLLVTLLAASYALVSAAHDGSPQIPLGAPSHIADHKLFALHKTLVNTESISGNEHDVGVFLTDYLRIHGFTVEHQTLPPMAHNHKKASRNNIYAYRGSHRQTRVLLTSHIDTVPPFYPYSYHHDSHPDAVSEGSSSNSNSNSNGTKHYIRGRGAVDAKASVAAQITALLSLLSSERIQPGDCALLFVVGEEVDGDGMIAANALGLSWDAVIFGEPTEGKLVSGHKGVLRMTVTAHGRAGHSGYPWLGENANSMLLPALLALERAEKDLPRSARFGNTTLNLGVVSGGVAANVIAETAEASIQIRLGGGTVDEVTAKLTQVVHDADSRLEVVFGGQAYPPVECDTDIAGFETIAVNYGTDVPRLKGAHKRYLYGPGSILVAHSADELLEVQELTGAVEGYERLVLGALGK